MKIEVEIVEEEEEGSADGGSFVHFQMHHHEGDILYQSYVEPPPSLVLF